MKKLKGMMFNIIKKVGERGKNFGKSTKEKKVRKSLSLKESIFSVDNLLTLLNIAFVVGIISLLYYMLLGSSSDNNEDSNITTNGGVAVVAESSINNTPTLSTRDANNVDGMVETTSFRVTSSHMHTALRDHPIKKTHSLKYSNSKDGDFSIEEYLPDFPDLPDMSDLITYEGSVETLKAVVDKKSYKQSDLLIIGDTKIWFGKNSVKINDDDLCMKSKNKLICRLEGVDISNVGIVRQLTKQKIGKIRIGRHKKETWIVVSPNSSYSSNFEIKEVGGREYEEEVVFHKKNSTTNRRTYPARTHSSAVSSTKLSQSRIKHWSDSDGLYLGSEFVATFKRDRVTLERGSCELENSKWVCTIPNKKVQWEDVSQKIRYMNSIVSVRLNLDPHTKRDTRVIITPKYGYHAVKKRVNGKEVLVFEHK